ncbi:MAG: AEC family transporter [Candidatus Symbiothrix sp.]|jgi:predicted permease|nr:AEC family transporter [Candidatus Symbiothrix sp.]
MLDNFIFSLNVVLPLFVLMAAGYIVRHIRMVKLHFFAQLNKLVFQFFLPLMLFQDIRSSYNGDFSNTKLIITAVVGITAIIALSFLMVPLLIKQSGRRGSIIQAIYRSNFLIYGLPLATGMYGQEAVAGISMLMCIMIPFYNVSAVIILSVFSETGEKKATVKNVLKDIATNPLILGSILGLLGGMTHLQLPEFLDRPLISLAMTATPLALFVMGGEFRFGSLRDNIVPVILTTVTRLLIVPVIVLFICARYLEFRGVDLAILVSLFATPTAMASYIMAYNMGNDGKLAGQIVVLSTACSCVTIFLIIYCLRAWGLL